VGRGLVGHDVDRGALRQHPRQQLRRVAEQADGERAARVARLDRQLERVLQGVRAHVQVAVFDTALDRARVAVDTDGDAVVHGHGERLRAAHPAQARGQGDRPGQRAVELLRGHRRERLVRALEDALRADVDPRAGRHLPVHRQAQLLKPAELLPVRPVADQVGVRDEHARRPLVRLHHADRAAGLDEHRLVLLERPQRAHHRVVGAPVAGRLARAAVDDELVGVLGDLGVEVVLKHAEGGFLLPSQGAQFTAARCPYGAGS
jgi:hypothetical protein